MPTVRTTDPDGEDVEFDPAVLMGAIVDGTLAGEPAAEEVAGALVLGWMQEVVKKNPDAPGGDSILSWNAATFVQFIKDEPHVIQDVIESIRNVDAAPSVIAGQRRMWGWRRPGS